MTVVMGVDKRCAASGRALQVESAVSEIQRVKRHLRKTLQKSSKCMHKRQFATMSSLHSLISGEDFVIKLDEDVWMFEKSVTTRDQRKSFRL